MKDWRRVWRLFKTYARDFLREVRRPNLSIPILQSLRPEKGLPEHRLYVDELTKATGDGETLNIALTGSYGSGKSSILRDFIESGNHRVVQISFSSLGANIEGYINGNKTTDEHERLNDLTNLIQKEIVKQILFKEKTKNLPYSKFKRVSGPRVILVLCSSILLSALTLAILISNGWLSHIYKLDGMTSVTLRIWATFSLYVTLFSALSLFFLTLGGKIKIDKIGHSSLTLSLTGKNNYFDQYLDEIIYFFEASKYDVVIFEDIDRFNNLYIFENLRQLNTILNSSKQIGRHIKFIYAVKDSIFSQKTLDADKEKTDEEKTTDKEHKERSANRTKFFDLIIPVVPFITSTSSRDRMLGEFETAHREDLRGPVAIVAKYVIDMRLVKNIRNEFLIFSEKVIVEGSDLQLNKLFAMVAYKNWNLDEFEKIKDGKSMLDMATESYGAFIDQRISDINRNIAEKRQTLKDLKNVQERAKAVGEKLTDHMDAIVRQTGSSALQYSLNGTAYDIADLVTVDFWEAVAKGGEDNSLIVSYRTGNGYPINMTLNTADIRSICGESLDPEGWRQADAEQYNNEVKALQSEITRLPRLNISQLMSDYSAFTKELRELGDGGLTEDGMTWDLLKAGYIDTDFVHYTSIYHSMSMSLKARSFLLNNLRLDKQSLHHKFEDDDDIEALLNEAGPTYLKDKSMYNIMIVDHLLKVRGDKRISDIIANLSGGQQEDIRFIDAYIKEGAAVNKLVELLAASWPNIFVYLADNADMDEEKKRTMLSVALTHADPKIKYQPSPALRNFVRERMSSENLLSGNHSDEDLAKACDTLQALGVTFQSFNGLSEKAQSAIKDYYLYDVNEANLKFVLGNGKMPLDTIKKTDPNTYEHVLSELTEYIDIFDNSKNDEYMLAGDDGFESVIDDLSKISLDDLDRVLAKADLSNCVVADINTLQTNIWPALVRNVIISNTLSNMLAYFSFTQTNDKTTVKEDLADFLSAIGSVTLDKEYSEYVEDELTQFVLAVLNTPSINAEIRSYIASECYTASYVETTQINKQDGPLYGYLLKNDVIEDTATNFKNIQDLAWDTKSAYIHNSEKFLEYITSITLSTEELDKLISDATIPESIKDYIAQHIVTYAPNMSDQVISSLADHALAQGISLDAESLKIVARCAQTETGIKLLNLSTGLTGPNMLEILPIVGGEYAKLAQPNKRPTFNQNDHNTALINRLKVLGFISSTENTGDKIKVRMKSRL